MYPAWPDPAAHATEQSSRSQGPTGTTPIGGHLVREKKKLTVTAHRLKGVHWPGF